LNRSRKAGPRPEAVSSARLVFPLIFLLVKGLKKCHPPRVRTVIYPGSFDPLTNGHLDVIQRAAKLFERVVVAIAKNENKNPLFSMAERREMVKKAVVHLPNVEADTFDGLLVNYVVQQKARTIVRGLRAVSDFEFEFQLALMNRKLNEQVETIFMMPKDTYTFLSSHIVKEIARLGGDVSVFVPVHVRKALAEKFAAQKLPPV
jgi:pantetheine-phosphate adenylyltransferase